MNITGLVQEVAATEETTLSPYQQARAAGATEICIVIQYKDGVGVMRCFAGGRNIPTRPWRAIQGQVGYVEQDSADEGGMRRIVFEGGNA